MKFIKEAYASGERALFNSKDITIECSIFAEGESPLKESQNIEIMESVFKWKYPLWYCKNIKVSNTTFIETARSGIWYTEHIEMTDCTLDSPKTFRRSRDIVLTNVHMANAQETLWNCNTVELRNVHAQGDYFAMNSSDIYIDHLNLTGNYSFDGGKNIEVHNSVFVSKDAFWNCENVVVYDSTIIGEYLGWNSKNITFINCTIESLQGLCYIENLNMVNCKLINTSLAFEYSTLDVSITSHIDSVKNPRSGSIQANSIGEVILEEDKVNTSLTNIQYFQQPIMESKHQQTSCVC